MSFIVFQIISSIRERWDISLLLDIFGGPAKLRQWFIHDRYLIEPERIGMFIFEVTNRGVDPGGGGGEDIGVANISFVPPPPPPPPPIISTTWKIHDI